MKIENIDAQTLNKWLQANEAVLIDVREAIENKAESIAGAKLLPLSKVSMKDINLPEHQNKKLVIHCKSGRRSMMACEKLQDEKQKSETEENEGAPFDIWNLDGGIEAWKQFGLPIQTPDKNVIPLERQLFITVGTLVSLGVFLGHFIADEYYLIPLIVGFGLINSGLTGWCGMGKLIAKMPWNQ